MFNITIERQLHASDAAYPGETFFSHFDHATEQHARTAFNCLVYTAMVEGPSNMVSILLKDGLNVLAEIHFYVDDQEEEGE